MCNFCILVAFLSVKQLPELIATEIAECVVSGLSMLFNKCFEKSKLVDIYAKKQISIGGLQNVIGG